MDDLGRARTDFHGVDVVRLIERVGQDEVQEDVGAGGRQSRGPLDGQDKVRFAESPGFVVVRNGMGVGGVATSHAGGYPPLDESDFLAAEPALIFKVAVAMFGKPRWHVAALGDLHDLLRSPARVFKGEQAEGAAATGMMAGCAVLVEDGRNLPVERNRRFRCANADAQAHDVYNADAQRKTDAAYPIH